MIGRKEKQDKRLKEGKMLRKNNSSIDKDESYVSRISFFL